MVSDTKPVSECQLVICHCNMKKSQRVSHLSPVVGRPCLLQLRHPQNPMVRGAGGGGRRRILCWRFTADLLRLLHRRCQCHHQPGIRLRSRLSRLLTCRICLEMDGTLCSIWKRRWSCRKGAAMSSHSSSLLLPI